MRVRHSSPAREWKSWRSIVVSCVLILRYADTACWSPIASAGHTLHGSENGWMSWLYFGPLQFAILFVCGGKAPPEGGTGNTSATSTRLAVWGCDSRVLERPRLQVFSHVGGPAKARL